MAMFRYGLVLLACIAGLVHTADSINCYQCSSTDHFYPFQCNEYFPEDAELQPSSCEFVEGAKYCVKLVGRHGASGWWFWSGTIKCFECSAHDNLDCADNSINDGFIQPQDCSKIHGAKHCLKITGRFAGVYGTRRMCSSVNLGNYCDYVSMPGDDKDYRSCVYTCDTDGCNGASQLTSTNILLLLLFTSTLWKLVFS